MSNTPVVLDLLTSVLESRQHEIKDWFNETFGNTPPFFYNSIDIRHSGFKIAPVDTNIFPGGFNNLSQQERLSATPIIRDYFHHYYPDAQTLLIIAEDHTRNLYYFENLAVLKELLDHAGKKVILSSFSVSASGQAQTFTSHSGIILTFEPLIKHGNQVQTKQGITPDLLIINNDLTSGIPDLITNIAQPITPPPSVGWHQRRKTSHFEVYNELARNFCYHFNIDPWLITTFFSRCGVVNFKEQTGIECVALHIDKIIHQIKEKYAQYSIKQEPYVFIKSDRGTYGMGIMTATSGEEVLHLNKDHRKRMNAIKGGQPNTEVIIQEGIPTIDKIEHVPAEPMVYMVGGQTVGCIYRTNSQKDAYSNLNSPGMQFTSILPPSKNENPCITLRFIAKLACLASAWECYNTMYNI